MHLHLIEPRPDGHRMQYVRRLIEHAPRDWRISLSTFETSFDHPGTKEAQRAGGDRLRLVPMTGEGELELRVRGASGFALQPAYWQLFRRHWRSLAPAERGQLVVVPYLDYCSYAIGMLGSPFGVTPFSGIVMRTDFHWAESGVVAPVAPYRGFKRWLFHRLLQHKRLHRLVTIDPSLRDWAMKNELSAGGKLRYADDPADLQGQGDRGAARRRFGLRDGAFVVLLFGGIDLRKGLEDLLDAAASPLFPAQGQVLIVGQQSTEARNLIHARAASLPAGRLVCADRYVDREEEWLAFAAADCGWVAYRNFYGSSGVLAQCEQAALPVVYRPEGIIGYAMSACQPVAWPWLAGTALRGASAAQHASPTDTLQQVYESTEALGAIR